MLAQRIKRLHPVRSLFSPFWSVARHRQVLWATTLSELRGTYAGSVLGMIWVFLGPLLLLALYALIFAVIFRVRPVNLSVSEYVLYVFSGLVPFLAFSAALNAGALSLSIKKEILLNTVFPPELIPLRSVLVASVSLPAGLVVIFLGDAIFSRLSLTWLFVPLIVIAQALFLIGLCWILSLLALLVRDIQQFLVYVTIMLMIVTPIAYTPDMIPEKLALIAYANPLFYFVDSYQRLIVFNEMPPVRSLVAVFTLGLGSFWSGHALFHRAKQTFYDYA